MVLPCTHPALLVPSPAPSRHPQEAVLESAYHPVCGAPLPRQPKPCMPLVSQCRVLVASPLCHLPGQGPPPLPKTSAAWSVKWERSESLHLVRGPAPAVPCMSPCPPGGLRPGARPQDILEWRTARTFLYWRLRRLLLEDQVKQEILQASSELSHVHIQSMLRRWFVETEGAVKVGLGWRRGGDGAGPAGGQRLARLLGVGPISPPPRPTCGTTTRWWYSGWNSIGRRGTACAPPSARTSSA